MSRAEVFFQDRVSIRSGGQTGVDRAALDAAIAKNIPRAGWCPRGGWAEDFPSPPGLLTLYDGLVETPSEAPEQRTAWNVRDSHASLLLVKKTSADSQGTIFTRMCAELIFERPYYVADLDVTGQAEDVRQWLRETTMKANSHRFDLNIAGPRESECPGIYHSAYDFILQLL